MKISNESDGLSSKCLHVWGSKHHRVTLDACTTEAFAQGGNVVNYHAEKQRCNVKRCEPDEETEDAETMTDEDRYKLTDMHGGWDVYVIRGEFTDYIVFS